MIISNEQLPVIILKGIILLPNNEIKLEFDTELSRNIVEISESLHNNKLLIVSREDPLEESIDINNLPTIGVISEISHKIDLPNGKTRLIITGLKRVHIDDYLNSESGILKSVITDIEEEKIEKKEEEALIKKLYKELEIYIKVIPYASNSILSMISNIDDLNVMTDIIVPYLDITQNRMIEYLNITDTKKRVELIIKDINNEIQTFKIEKELDNKVKKEMDETQKKFILKEKMKQIKKELGDTTTKESEIQRIKNKIDSLNLEDNIRIKIEEELNRYESLPDTSPEASVVRNYLEWLVNIPWGVYTSDNNDLNDIEAKLNKSHSGLNDLKDRFIEYIAVRQKSNNLKSPIICLIGPPGVGKTSFVFSLAKALDRNFVKVSVGGINDEAEIMGHRRTYLGAIPGKIISSLKKAKSMNPVFLIDEIDKMTKDHKGDPASALLEVLDPEQNKYFTDSYMDIEVDLSNVMFVTTANSVDDIPIPLRDRLEIIEISGYTEFEKLEIAQKYLLPKVCMEHGLDSKEVIISDELLLKIIREYTKESGVRELERVISKLIRKIITSLLKKKITVSKLIIDEKSFIKYLGNPKYENTFDQKLEIGVVNGLAYTPYGGDTLKIEVNYYKGKGLLQLTGSLGEVMEESCKIALSYIKSNYKKFGIDYKIFKENDIHIHVPEGAIKKDGPSAGIAITTAIISSLIKARVDEHLAMTGEITLTGKILKIGGLKEKSISALRNGIDKIIIPKDNLKDIQKFPDEVKEKIRFIPVSNYLEAFDIMRSGFGE